MGMYADLESVLEDLVNRLNQFNQPDMLDGYLDGLAEEFNTRLDALGAPVIKPVYPEKGKWHLGIVTHSDEVVVLDSMNRTRLAVPIDSIVIALGITRDMLTDELAEEYIKETYNDVLEDIDNE